jgi:hypothetical protein
MVTTDEFIIQMNAFVERVGVLMQETTEVGDQIEQQEEQPLNTENRKETQEEPRETPSQNPVKGERIQMPVLEP